MWAFLILKRTHGPPLSNDRYAVAVGSVTTHCAGRREKPSCPWNLYGGQRGKQEVDQLSLAARFGFLKDFREPGSRGAIGDPQRMRGRSQALASGEPGFYFVGSRSYGSAPSFLLRNGLAQLETILDSLQR